MQSKVVFFLICHKRIAAFKRREFRILRIGSCAEIIVNAKICKTPELSSANAVVVGNSTGKIPIALNLLKNKLVWKI